MKSLKSFFASKKSKGFLIGLISTALSTYVLKDKPELANDVATMIVGLTSAYLLGQGAADAFGGSAYHKK